MVAYTGGGAQGLSTRVSPPTVASNYKRKIDKINEKVKNDAESLGSQERQGNNLLSAMRSHDRITSQVTEYELQAYAKGFEGLTKLYQHLVVDPTIKKNKELFEKGAGEASQNSSSGKALSQTELENNNKIRSLDQKLANNTTKTAQTVVQKTGNIDLAQKINDMPEAYRNGYLFGKMQKAKEGISVAYYNRLEEWRKLENKDGTKGQVFTYIDSTGKEVRFNINETITPEQSRVVKEVFLKDYTSKQIWEINPGMFDTRFVQQHFSDGAWKELQKIQKEDEVRYRTDKAVQRQADLKTKLKVDIRAITDGDTETAKETLKGYVNNFAAECAIIGKSATCRTDGLDDLANTLAEIQATDSLADIEGTAETINELLKTTKVEGPNGQEVTLPEQWKDRFSPEKIGLKAAEIINSRHSKLKSEDLAKADIDAAREIKNWGENELSQEERINLANKLGEGKSPWYRQRLYSHLVTNYRPGYKTSQQAKDHLDAMSFKNDGVITPADLVGVRQADIDEFKENNPDVEFRDNLFGYKNKEGLKSDDDTIKNTVANMITNASVSNTGEIMGDAKAKVDQVLKQLKEERLIRAKLIKSEYARDNNGAKMPDSKAYNLAMKEQLQELKLANLKENGIHVNKGRLTVNMKTGFDSSYWDIDTKGSEAVQVRADILRRATWVADRLGHANEHKYNIKSPLSGVGPNHQGRTFAAAKRDYLIITDPSMLQNPNHPTVIEAANILGYESPTAFLKDQRKLIGGDMRVGGDDDYTSADWGYPGEELIVTGGLVTHPVMREQYLLQNPNKIDTKRATGGTVWGQDSFLLEDLDGQLGDFPINNNHLAAATSTYPDKPILRFKEAIRLASGLTDINDPQIGKYTHLARLKGVNFNYNRRTT